MLSKTKVEFDENDYKIVNLLLDYKLKRLGKQENFFLSRKLLKFRELKGRVGNSGARTISEVLSKTEEKSSAEVANKELHYKIASAALRYLAEKETFSREEMEKVSWESFQRNSGHIRWLEFVMIMNRSFGVRVFAQAA
jgi:hypothetical protein